MSFISSFGSNDYSGSGFGEWGNRFPDEANTGTENPRSNPERTQRIAYLENKVYNLQEQVRNCDAKVDAAKNKVSSLLDKLSYAKDAAYAARERHHATGKRQAGLEGKIAGNKNKIRYLREQLRNTTDTWAINEIKQEIEQRENNRWTLSDELSSATDAYYQAKENKNNSENRVSELERNVESARTNVENCREDCRLRKEQLSDHRRELENLKSA